MSKETRAHDRVSGAATIDPDLTDPPVSSIDPALPPQMTPRDRGADIHGARLQNALTSSCWEEPEDHNDALPANDDAASHRASTVAWLARLGVRNPVDSHGMNVGDVVAELRDTFPGAQGAHLGLVTRSLFGDLVDGELLKSAIAELTQRLHIKSLRDRVTRARRHEQASTEEEQTQLGEDRIESNPMTMAPFWAEVPEIEPPKGDCMFGSWTEAVDAVTASFPVLAEHPDVRASMAMVLWGGIGNTTPESFGKLAEQARALEALSNLHMPGEAQYQTSVSADPGIGDMVIVQTRGGGERLLNSEELTALREVMDHPPETPEAWHTLDQKTGGLLKANDGCTWEAPHSSPAVHKPPVHTHEIPTIKKQKDRAVPRLLIAVLIGLVLAFLILSALYLLSSDAVQNERINQVEDRVQSLDERVATTWNRTLRAEGENITLTDERDLALSQRDQALVAAGGWAGALEKADKSNEQLERRLRLEISRANDKSERAMRAVQFLTQQLEEERRRATSEDQTSKDAR